MIYQLLQYTNVNSFFLCFHRQKCGLPPDLLECLFLELLEIGPSPNILPKELTYFQYISEAL